MSIPSAEMPDTPEGRRPPAYGIGPASASAGLAARLRGWTWRWRSLPDLRQDEPAECGAVALATALAWFGSAVPLDELRRECRVSRDGASALDLVRAAKRYGLAVLAVEGPADAILELPLPMIALMEAQHFVLVTHLRGGMVGIADPAAGRCEIGNAEFTRRFRNVALSLRPGSGFRARRAAGAAVRPHPPQPRRRLPLLLVTVLPGLLGAAWLFAGATRALSHGTADGLPLVPILSAAALAGATGGIAAYLAARWRHADRVRLGGDALQSLLAMPVELWERRHAVALAARLGTLGHAASGAIDRLFLMVCAAAAAVAAGLAGIAAPRLGLLALCLLAAIALLARLGDGRGQSSLAERIEQRRRRRLVDAVAVFSALRPAEDLDAQIDAVAADYEAATHHAAAARHRGLLAGAAGIAAVAAAAAIGAWWPVERDIGTLVFVAAAAAPFLVRLMRRQARPALRADLAPPPATSESMIETIPPAELRGALSVSGLRYARPGAPPCLAEIAFAAAPGERVALVGPSGSGKSTLLDLLAGLRRAEAGAISLDARPVDRLEPRLRARLIGHMAQDIRFFDASLRANLAALDEGVPEDSVTEAVALVGLHERVARRRGGYLTSLADDGSRFSGGERALLELARLLVARPALLLLDEPTASLDAESEQRALAAMLESGATMVVATHSPAVAAACDRVLLLGGGRILAAGTHRDLLAGEPRYRVLMGHG